MNSRTTAMRVPCSGFPEASLTRKLEYGSFGMIPGGIAVNMSSELKPFTASVTVRQCTPARSPELEYPGPPSIITPFVASTLTTPLREAGPLHDADVCSQIPHMTRFADTETPEPLLVPRGTRDVSYGLQACPAHAASWKLPFGIYVFAFAGPRFAERPVAEAVDIA